MIAPKKTRRTTLALLKEIRSCTVCAADLPLGPRPVVAFEAGARVLIVGQAPGTAVHKSGVPWDDPSGDTLRAWMGVSPEEFYDASTFAIVPMGLCYPGRGRSGDLPPRSECAPLWHARILALLDVKLTLLIGTYAQGAYLGSRRKRTLTETVRSWREYDRNLLPLPHPSPRNRPWLAKNPWFQAEVLPVLRRRLRAATR